MKLMYSIVGLNRQGNEVMISIRNDMVKEKLDPITALKDLGGFVQKMQMTTGKMNTPDRITIPFDEWEKHQYKLGDVIEIDVNPRG